MEKKKQIKKLKKENAALARELVATSVLLAEASAALSVLLCAENAPEEKAGAYKQKGEI